MNITLAKTINGGVSTTISKYNYNILSHTKLRGCPFENYTAWDLLHDLEIMYSWKMEKGRSYTIIEFLDLCNDIHAAAYKEIYAA